MCIAVWLRRPLLALSIVSLSAMQLLAPCCLLLLRIIRDPTRSHEIPRDPTRSHEILRIIRDTTLVWAAASTTVPVIIRQAAASAAPSRYTAGKLRTTTAAGG
jgi:hypothetical protein